MTIKNSPFTIVTQQYSLKEEGVKRKLRDSILESKKYPQFLIAANKFILCLKGIFIQEQMEWQFFEKQFYLQRFSSTSLMVNKKSACFLSTTATSWKDSTLSYWGSKKKEYINYWFEVLHIVRFR